MTAVADPYLETLNPAGAERYLVSLLCMSSMRVLRSDALTEVPAGAFWSQHYRDLWAAAQRLNEAGKRIDPRTLAAEAEGRNATQVLATLADDVPDPADYADAVRQVTGCAKQRKVLELGDFVRQCAGKNLDYDRTLELITERFDELTATETPAGFVEYPVLLERFEQVMRKGPAEHTVIPTPWSAVNDKLAGGLHGGRVYVVGGRPGDGKSVAGGNFAHHAAECGFTSAVFSIEMGALEVASRFVANGATIEMDEIARRDLSSYAWQCLHEYVNRATGFPIFVDDRSEVSVPTIRAACKALNRARGLDVVVVDYLQLLKADQRLPREQQVAAMSKALKLLARELDVAVVVLAQVNRKAAEKGKPALSDLRESDAIGADADVVMLLSRQFFTEGDMAGKPNGMVEVDIPKNRQGAPASFQMWLKGNYARIAE